LKRNVPLLFGGLDEGGELEVLVQGGLVLLLQFSHLQAVLLGLNELQHIKTEGEQQEGQK